MNSPKDQKPLTIADPEPIQQENQNTTQDKLKSNAKKYFNIFDNKLADYIRKNQKKVITISLITIILLALFIAILLGINLAKKSNNKITPDEIIQPTPSTQALKESLFTDLKKQVQDFPILLPDPAPPAIDYNITLNPPKKF